MPPKFSKNSSSKKANFFTSEKLNQDVEKIRKALRDEKFLAPELDEPRVVFDSEKNTINIDINRQSRRDFKSRLMPKAKKSAVKHKPNCCRSNAKERSIIRQLSKANAV